MDTITNDTRVYEVTPGRRYALQVRMGTPGTTDVTAFLGLTADNPDYLYMPDGTTAIYGITPDALQIEFVATDKYFSLATTGTIYAVLVPIIL